MVRADIFHVEEKNKVYKIYIETKTTFETFLNQKLLFLNLKDFIFYKHICKMYTL